MRYCRILLFSLISLILVALLATVYLTTTTSGARVTLAIANAIMDDTIKAKHIDGRLIYSVTLQDITYQTADHDTAFTAKQAKLTWDPFAFILNKATRIDVNIDRLQLKTTTNTQPLADTVIQQGQLILTGHLNQYHMHATATVDVAQSHNNQLTLDGSGDRDGINSFSLKMTGPLGNITATGQYRWTPTQTWQTSIKTTRLDLSLFSPWLPEQLSFDAIAQGNLQTQPTMLVNVSNLSGRYHNQLINGHIAYQRKHNQQHTSLKLQVGDANVTANAKLNNTITANWAIAIPDLSQIQFDMQGQLQSHGNITGTVQQPYIQAKLTAKKLHWKQYTVDDFQFNTVGNKAKHQTYLRAQNSQLRATIALTGNYQQPHWQGVLSTATLTTQTPAMRWQLTHPVSLTIGNDATTIAPFCWSNTQQSRLCGKLTQTSTHSWDSQLTLEKLPLHALAALFGHTAHGIINASINLHRQRDGFTTGQGQLTVSKGSMTLPINQINQTIHFSDSNMAFELDNDGLRGQLNWIFDPQQSITATVTLPDYHGKAMPIASQPLQASTNATLTDLTWVATLLPNLADVKGILQAAFDIKGTWAAPQITGNMRLEQGQIKLVPLGITLTQLLFQLNATKSNHFAWQGHLQSGKGTLQLKGNTIFNTNSIATSCHISGDQVEIINTNDYQATVTPDLNIKQTTDRIDITGKLTIPSANLHPVNVSSVVTLPKETVIIQPNATQKAHRHAVYANVDVVLGDDININMFGVTGKLNGDLQLATSPKTFTTANGHLQIANGRFEFFGKTLDINKGRLLFSGGDVSNPGLAIRASKTMTTFNQATNADNDTLIVGVDISGNADNPKATLFSKPSGLNQSEILSYLVLGKPLNQASPTDSALLIRALTTLNSGGASTDSITEELKHTFKLDQLSVGQVNEYDPEQNDTVSNTGVVLGKALSPDLYVSYSIGLFAPVNILRARYTIGHGWSMQATNSDLGTGGDLFYSFSIK